MNWPDLILPPINLWSLPNVHVTKMARPFSKEHLERMGMIDNAVKKYENTIESTLRERGKRYGDFKTHADITQRLKDVMRDTPNWGSLSNDKKEALEMVAHKIGRILNGDPEYADSWHDIIGYSKLVEDTLT